MRGKWGPASPVSVGSALYWICGLWSLSLELSFVHSESRDRTNCIQSNSPIFISLTPSSLFTHISPPVGNLHTRQAQMLPCSIGFQGMDANGVLFITLYHLAPICGRSYLHILHSAVKSNTHTQATVHTHTPQITLRNKEICRATFGIFFVVLWRKDFAMRHRMRQTSEMSKSCVTLKIKQHKGCHLRTSWAHNRVWNR